MWRSTIGLALFLLPLLGHAQLSVEDALGRRVVLPQAATRIVSLAPHATEMLFAAGAGERVVGVVQYSDYPPQARSLPQVGGYTRLDIEAILALHPDLVVAWGSGNKGDTVKRLEELGLPVYYTEPRQLADISQDIRRLGRLAGSDAAAEAEAARLEQGLEALRLRYQGRPPIRVFYQIWDAPMMTVNGEHLINKVIELCGGENVFATAPSLTPRVGVEAVLEAGPEAIIASGMASERPEWLDGWRRWPQLPAVRQQALFSLPPALIQRQGPRILQGAQQMCEQLESIRH